LNCFALFAFAALTVADLTPKVILAAASSAGVEKRAAAAGAPSTTRDTGSRDTEAPTRDSMEAENGREEVGYQSQASMDRQSELSRRVLQSQTPLCCSGKLPRSKLETAAASYGTDSKTTEVHP